eukprot:4935454-Amphidinium_carterae.1
MLGLWGPAVLGVGVCGQSGSRNRTILNVNDCLQLAQYASACHFSHDPFRAATWKYYRHVLWQEPQRFAAPP